MNERIKELADKCFSTLPHEDELEKFAELIVQEFTELIVQECEAICQDVDGDIGLESAMISYR